jgi:hypothetical protein
MAPTTRFDVQSCEASLVVYTNLFWAGQPTDNTLLLVGNFNTYNFRFLLLLLLF